MIDVVISPQCREIMAMLEIGHEMVVTAINDRDRGLLDDGFTRIAAVHWFSDDQIVFVDSVVTKSEFDNDQHRVRFEEVTAHVVLDLSARLPAGLLDRSMTMEQILSVIAESFGEPVTCHPDREPATLYSGPWDGKTIDVRIETPGTIGVCGSFMPDNGTCELVWAFNLERYRDWFVGV